jgi:hypothetical protein
MNDPVKLTPEDIAQYREQFSQNNQQEALNALDVIEEKNGNLIIAASELAIEENIVVSKSISNIVCDEEFIDKVMEGLLSSAVASLCATGQIPEAVAAPIVIYLARKGIQKWCNSDTEG